MGYHVFPPRAVLDSESRPLFREVSARREDNLADLSGGIQKDLRSVEIGLREAALAE